MSTAPSLSERADELEHRQMQELGERVVVKSLLYRLADGERTLGPRARGARLLMGEEPRLPPMPEKPGLLDFFRLRFAPTQAHLLQSARLAQFEDVIGRHFRQPSEGLGNDNTPSSHIWRTLRRPCNAL